MRSPIAVSIVSLVSTLAAADAPRKPATAVPTRTVPCAPTSSELHASGDDPVLCWETGCMALDLLDPKATLIKAKPAPQAGWLAPLGEIRDLAGKPAVCVGASCKPLGKKLAAAIEAARKEATPDQPVVIEGTTDLKAVVVGSTPWSVAQDKELKLKPGVKGLDGGGATVAGSLLVATFSNCAGPCTQAGLFDSAGAARSKLFTGGGAVLQLDPKRFTVVDEYGTVHAFAVGTGASLGSLELGGGDPEAAAVRIGEVLAVRHGGMQGVTVTQVNFDGARVFRGSEMFLPTCAQ